MTTPGRGDLKPVLTSWGLLMTVGLPVLALDAPPEGVGTAKVVGGRESFHDGCNWGASHDWWIIVLVTTVTSAFSTIVILILALAPPFLLPILSLAFALPFS
eukprot:2737260-Amphidinium_carterae.1